MMKPRTQTTESFANPELVRQLERDLSDAVSKAHSMGALVCQGRATQEEKTAAFAAAAELEAKLKAEQKNVI